MKGARRKRGYLLLPVTAALLVIAMTAALLTRSSAHEAKRGGVALDAQRARYAAESGIEHLRWELDRSNCANYANLNTTSFGTAGQYVATVSATSGSPVSVTAIGSSSSGADFTLTRADLPVFATSARVGFLQPGASAGKDTRIEEDKVDHNHGDNKELDVDAKTGARNHSLLEFDLSALQGVKIDAAELALYLYDNNGSQTAVVSAHRVLKRWDERENDRTNWEEARSNADWDQDGGDYDATSFDAFVASGVGWKTLNLTQLVRLWTANEFPNYGLLLRSEDGGQSGKKRFYSSDEGDATLRPKLTIAYRCECGATCPTLSTVTNQRLLFVVKDADALTEQELEKKALFESWDYEVSLISAVKAADDLASAAALANVIFIGSEISAFNLRDKLESATVGIVIEQPELADEFQLATGEFYDPDTQLEITDNTHYITESFPLGALTISTSSLSLSDVVQAYSVDLELLARNFYAPALVAIEVDRTLVDFNLSAGRRVRLPWGDRGFDIAALNADALTLLRRSIDWAAGAGPAGGLTYNALVAASSDDAEERSDTGQVSVTSSDLELPFSSAERTDLVGLRFLKVPLTADASIRHAFINFHVDEAGSAPTTIDIRAQAVDDAETFSSSSFNLSSRPRTSASVSWSPPPWRDHWAANTRQQTPDIKALIEEVIARPGWSAGNDIAFLLSGSGTRTAVAMDDFPPVAARLHIEYDASGGTGSSGVGRGESPPSTPGGDTCSAADDFESGDYQGSTGQLDWATDWLEVNEKDGPSSGDERVVNDNGSRALRVRDNDGGGEGVQRSVDLGTHTSATLRFEYRREGLDRNSDYVLLEVSPDDSNWNEIDRFAGPADDTSYRAAEYTLDEYLGQAQLGIRFRSSSTLGGADKLYFDNVEIEASGGSCPN